ncbi:MAG: DegV family protein, partial [Syntrophomonadaceae bacterium]|nr:DegV family protein [Syntrophomonadaceae bacterium]
MPVRIISDNCCDLPGPLLEEYGISLVHMPVYAGQSEWDPAGLDAHAFYRWMKSSPVLPTTSQPPLEEMIRCYREALDGGGEAVAIHLSSGMTGTVQTAELARAQLPDPQRLVVIDSLKASLGQGLLVLHAARLARQGLAAGQVVAEVLALRQRMRCFFTLDTLEYLLKGGRVTRSQALMGNVLDIKPILHVNPQGVIEPYERARGRRGALRRLLQVVQREAGQLQGQTVAVSHADAR